MIFADFYGTPSLFGKSQEQLQERIAAVFRARAEDVVVRRIEVDSDYPGAEIWIELSSDEQLARYGRELAREATAVIREHAESDVWVLFRVVPLSHVYMNGEPRRRGGGTLD